jgi:hypothetical protein
LKFYFVSTKRITYPVFASVNMMFYASYIIAHLLHIILDIKIKDKENSNILKYYSWIFLVHVKLSIFSFVCIHAFKTVTDNLTWTKGITTENIYLVEYFCLDVSALISVSSVAINLSRSWCTNFTSWKIKTNYLCINLTRNVTFSFLVGGKKLNIFGNGIFLASLLSLEKWAKN